MNRSEWEANNVLLESIIEEIVNEENLTQYHSDIMGELHTVLNHYSKDRLRIKDFDELNKVILSTMYEFITNIKNNGARQQVNSIIETPRNIMTSHNTIHTKEDLQNERLNEFTTKLNYVKQDFDDTLRKRPQEIDFSDKNDEPDDTIDNLMEKEMLKRKYDIQELDDTKKKEAEQWLKNGNMSLSQGNINTSQPYSQYDAERKIKIIDNDDVTNKGKQKVKSILKKISFSADTVDEKDKLSKTNETFIQKDILTTEKNKNIQEKNENHESKNIHYLKDKYDLKHTNDLKPINYIILNKNNKVVKTLPFLKNDLFISLYEVSNISVNIKETSGFDHSTHCFIDHNKTNDKLYYLRTLETIYIKETRDLQIKLMANKKQELFLSLHNHIQPCLNIKEIISTNIEYTYASLPCDIVDNSNSVLLCLDSDFDFSSLLDYDLYINNTKLAEYLPIVIDKVERKKNTVFVNIENIYNKNKFNGLIVEKKYLNEVKNCETIQIMERKILECIYV